MGKFNFKEAIKEYKQGRGDLVGIVLRMKGNKADYKKLHSRLKINHIKVD